MQKWKAACFDSLSLQASYTAKSGVRGSLNWAKRLPATVRSHGSPCAMRKLSFTGIVGFKASILLEAP